ncbi:FKBP-type peptidyl-prolyl cis-trans isomerase [Pedobacter rhizosphaerae]|uniref:Peptidyl-prolyl cis-trans isomerase n=1 Tax=Pedobacter rhizosphaerae TaxID=390241 RepID=A0A1H9LA87_9SPHI|nr:FKBP-type peptidyl-prolyl cis-trans isomerase [Pedobacter rhizosphaerae]SER07913.1 FKBP-type peptidyl-prolyl cis-trans isomerase [Pedobacter rhizosphaerae]
MKKYTLAVVTLLAATLLFNSCKKEYDSIQTVDEAAIQAYIKKNNLNMKRDDLGVYYQIIEAGTGALIKNTDSVLFTYQEKSITDPTIYYSTSVKANEGTYLGYIRTNKFNKSWFKALDSAYYGAKIRMLIPSHLAYGKNGYSAYNVPSNAIIDTYLNLSTYNKQWQWDDAKIQAFLTSKGLTATKDASRVYYITNTVGTGTDVIDENSTVVFKYTGRYTDGTVFDSSTDGTYSTTLAGLIAGWKKIVPKYTAGAKFRMIVPSDLAYGPNGLTDQAGNILILPNSVLDFDLEIVSVTN